MDSLEDFTRECHASLQGAIRPLEADGREER